METIIGVIIGSLLAGGSTLLGIWLTLRHQEKMHAADAKWRETEVFLRYELDILIKLLVELSKADEDLWRLLTSPALTKFGLNKRINELSLPLAQSVSVLRFQASLYTTEALESVLTSHALTQNAARNLLEAFATSSSANSTELGSAIPEAERASHVNSLLASHDATVKAFRSVLSPHRATSLQ